MYRIDFHARWFDWMRVCVCESSMAVLLMVAQRQILKCIRDWDKETLYHPSCILLWRKGLRGWSKRTVVWGCLKGKRFLQTSITLFYSLQMTPFWWVRGLGTTYGVSSLTFEGSFWSCSISSIPLRFLGILVGQILDEVVLEGSGGVGKSKIIFLEWELFIIEVV